MSLLWQRRTAGMFYYSSAPAAERGRGRHVGREPYPIKSRCQLENHLHLMGFHQHERWADKYQVGRRRGADGSILMVRWRRSVLLFQGTDQPPRGPVANVPELVSTSNSRQNYSRCFRPQITLTRAQPPLPV